MFEAEQQKIAEYRRLRTYINIAWVAAKLAIAYALITYVELGIYIVIGYILYALETTAGLQFINSKEIDLQLNILNQRVEKLEGKSDG